MVAVSNDATLTGIPRKGAERAFPDTVQQIECPSFRNFKEGEKVDIIDNAKWIIDKTIPQTLGYMATNFSGLGSNNADSFLEKLGVKGEYKDSRRVFGGNYFQATGQTCKVGDGACQGQPQYNYVRNYPLSDMKGNLSFAIVDDLLDLNPMSVMRGMFGSAPGLARCKQVTLPVGTNLQDPTLLYDSFPAFLAEKKKCTEDCNAKHEGDPSSAFDCTKKCGLGWWEGTACIAPPAATREASYPEEAPLRTYKIPVGTSRTSSNKIDDTSPPAKAMERFTSVARPPASAPAKKAIERITSVVRPPAARVLVRLLLLLLPAAVVLLLLLLRRRRNRPLL